MIITTKDESAQRTRYEAITGPFAAPRSLLLRPRASRPLTCDTGEVPCARSLTKTILRASRSLRARRPVPVLIVDSYLAGGVKINFPKFAITKTQSEGH